MTRQVLSCAGHAGWRERCRRKRATGAAIGPGLRLRRSSVGGCRHTAVNRPGRPPERCSKLGVCGVGVGAGHACRSRDSLRLLTPSDGRGKRHPSTCTEDEDDAPASSRVEDEEAPPSPSVASSDGGLNQFAKMRLIERGRATACSTSAARQRGAPCCRSLHVTFALRREPEK